MFINQRGGLPKCSNLHSILVPDYKITVSPGPYACTGQGLSMGILGNFRWQLIIHLVFHAWASPSENGGGGACILTSSISLNLNGLWPQNYMYFDTSNLNTFWPPNLNAFWPTTWMHFDPPLWPPPPKLCILTSTNMNAFWPLPIWNHFTPSPIWMASFF